MSGSVAVESQRHAVVGCADGVGFVVWETEAEGKFGRGVGAVCEVGVDVVEC